MKKLKSIFVSVCIALLSSYLNGCSESTSSENIKTAGMYADMEIISEDGGTTMVTVQLKVGGPNSNTYVKLSADDTLEVSDGSITKIMSAREPDINEYEYVATFDDTAGGMIYTIDFVRQFEESALGSSITLPASIDIQTPGDNEEIPRDQSFTITWLSTDDVTGFSLNVFGSCIKNYFTEVTYPGFYEWTINAGQLTKKGAEFDTCQATIETTREGNDGVISVEFEEGGRITAEMSNSKTFKSVN